MPLRLYTRAGQTKLRKYVSDCGGISEAAVKLELPSTLIHQVLWDEPVPDYALDRIENTVGPIRLMEKTTSSSPTDVYPQDPRRISEAEAEPVITLQDFVKSSGGLLAASLKLGVSTSTLQKILTGAPVSAPTAKKVVAALRAIDCSILPEHPDPSLSELQGLIEESASSQSKVVKGGTYPSTARKLQSGLPLSKSTRLKLGLASESEKSPRLSPHISNALISYLSRKLHEIAKSEADLVDLSSKWGINVPSLRRVCEGKPVTLAVAMKIDAALEAAHQGDQIVRRPLASIERLRSIHGLYKQLGTLEAVGEQVGLTRERVRQLLVKGRKLGLFEYDPREYPYVPKEKIIEDYRETRSLSRTARLNKIPIHYLKKLFTAYSITEQDLADYRLAGKRTVCIERFREIAESIGHPPTSTELQRTAKGRALYNRIARFWGSIGNFRNELNIPKPWHTRPHWLDPWRQIALITRMQNLDTLRDCLSTSNPMSVSELCLKSNFGANRVRRLLALLMATGEVQKVGQLSSTKYLLVNI